MSSVWGTVLRARLGQYLISWWLDSIKLSTKSDPAGNKCFLSSSLTCACFEAVVIRYLAVTRDLFQCLWQKKSQWLCLKQQRSPSRGHLRGTRRIKEWSWFSYNEQKTADSHTWIHSRLYQSQHGSGSGTADPIVKDKRRTYLLGVSFYKTN